jgi:hypothetical protein
MCIMRQTVTARLREVNTVPVELTLSTKTLRRMNEAGNPLSALTEATQPTARLA